MKLSEAIRLGAMVSGQAFFATCEPDGRRCALGAALAAIGCGGDSYTVAFDVWPVTHVYMRHPQCPDGAPMFVLSIMRELNDVYRWSREAIADWIEGIEHAQAADECEARLIDRQAVTA